MAVYSLRPEGFEPVRKRMYSRIVPFFLLIFAAAGAWVVLANQPGKALTLVFMAAMAVPVFVALYRGTRNAVQKQQLAWDTYRLEIRDDALVRKVANLPDMEIRRESISSVQEDKDGCLVIRGTGKYQCIEVPGSLDGLLEVRQQIEKWHAVEPWTGQRYAMLKAFAPAVALFGLMAVILISRDRIITALAGTLFCAEIAWMLIAIWRNPQYERRLKLSMLWLLVVAAPVAYFVFYTVTH